MKAGRVDGAAGSPLPVDSPQRLSSTPVVDASVIICTHNPRPEYLRRVLGALETQTFDKKRWELLVVDKFRPGPGDAATRAGTIEYSKVLQRERKIITARVLQWGAVGTD
jgi:hypothetical protein